MKSKFILIALFAFVFTSCDEIEELTEIDFTTNFTEEFVVPLSENSSNYNQSIVFSLANNSDIQPYMDQIEDIEILEADYQFTNYQGLDDATGTIEVTVASQTFGPYAHTFLDDFQSETQFPLGDNAELTSVATNLLNTQSLNLSFTSTQDPAQNGSLQIQVNVKVKVTVQPL